MSVLLADILREGHQSAVDGYCFVDEDEIPPGIVTLLRDPQLNENYAIPEAFDVLEVYLASSRRSDPPVSLAELAISPLILCDLYSSLFLWRQLLRISLFWVIL